MLEADLCLTFNGLIDVLSFSERVEGLLGYRRDDVLGSTVSLQQLIHPRDLPNLLRLFGATASDRSGGVHLRIRGADGRIRCIPFRYLREEAPHGAVILTLHVSKASTERLPDPTACTADLLAMLDSLDQCASIKDREHTIRQVNRSFRDLHADERDPIGKTDYDLFPEDYADRSYEA